jgi:hypothetical protein
VEGAGAVPRERRQQSRRHDIPDAEWILRRDDGDDYRSGDEESEESGGGARQTRHGARRRGSTIGMTRSAARFAQTTRAA